MLLKRMRLMLAFGLLIISLALLAWGLWPTLRERYVLSVSPANMSLPTATPTPSSFVPDLAGEA